MDAIYPNDPSIFQILSGGVTTSLILPGSANVIGGQASLVKMRCDIDRFGLACFVRIVCCLLFLVILHSFVSLLLAILFRLLFMIQVFSSFLEAPP
jgi:hypothetical protein